jgi:hypothetical protein
MLKINNNALIVIFGLLLIIKTNSLVYGQGRKIDASLMVYAPKAADTIISRLNGTYLSKFIIKNNGPDSIKIGDTYSFNITFGNVQYGYFFKYSDRNTPSGEQDTVEVLIKMTWDTDNNTTFCGTVYLTGYKTDSIKKESKTEIINNKFCQNVFHDSRLKISNLNTSSVNVYPNPTNGKINIQIENPSKYISIEVFDIFGRLIQTFENKQDKTLYEIQLTNLTVANNIVLLRVRNGNVVYNQKIFITE